MPGSEPSMRYIARLMAILMDHGTISITNLAMSSRINHKRCKRIVVRLEQFDYLETRRDGKRLFVSLTLNGKDYGSKLLELNSLNKMLNA